jgi:hypothetical protein
VTLGSPQLPQWLEIVSRRPRNALAIPTNRIERPTLLVHDRPVPVDVTLWSFADPQYSLHRQIDYASSVTALDHTALRLDRLISIAETATPMAAELPVPDGYNWSQSWAKLLRRVRDDSVKTLELSSQPIAQVVDPSAEEIMRASGRVDQWIKECRQTMVAPDMPQSIEAANAVNLDSWVPPQLGQWTCFVASGDANELGIDFSSANLASWKVQAIGLAAVVTLAAAAIAFMRWPASSDFVYRWPHAIAFLAGIAAWAWLQPSFLGLLVAGGSIILMLHSGWPGRSLRLEGSTVLRSTPPSAP